MLQKRNIFIGSIIIVCMGIVGYSFYFFQSSHQTVAKEIPMITITTCSAISPGHMMLEKGGEVTFMNADKVAHTISVMGKTLIIKSRKKANIQITFPEGDGTYTYDCDDIKDAGQLQTNMDIVDAQGDDLPSPPGITTFQSIYDVSKESVQGCIKDVLGKDFDDAYKNEKFAPEVETIMKINKCFEQEYARGNALVE